MKQCPCCGSFHPAPDFASGACPSCGAGAVDQAIRVLTGIGCCDVWRGHTVREIYNLTVPGAFQVLEFTPEALVTFADKLEAVAA